MKLQEIELASPIRWKLSADDPKSVPIASQKGWRVINPLVLMAASEKEVWVRRTSPGVWYVTATRLAISAEEELPVQSSFDLFVPLVNALRLTSRQASLRPSFVSVRTRDMGRLPVLLPPAAEGRSGFVFGRFRIETALTMAMVKTVGKLPVLDAGPVHHELIMDAIDAFQNSDYRQCILYAAISVESLARAVSEGIYAAAISGSISSAHMRVLPYTTSQGVVKKDPIYEVLANERFSRLLHEVPLYLMNRSMLHEDETLYASVTRLYGVRNKIGHGNQATPGQFPVDRAGALKALDVAAKAFVWFGDAGHILPDHDQVAFDA